MSDSVYKTLEQILELKRENDERANRIFGRIYISSENEKTETKKPILCRIGLHDWDISLAERDFLHKTRTCLRNGCGKQDPYKKSDYCGGMGPGPP